jgi:hypothetical protein
MRGFEGRQREWREYGKVCFPDPVANRGNGGQRKQIREQQSTATAWGSEVDLGAREIRSIQKTDGHTEFIRTDPCATEISVHRS